MNQRELVNQIRDMCTTGSSALSLSVLCESVGSMGLQEPLVVHEKATVKECLEKFQQSSAGGVCVVDDLGKLRGIFTERDCVLRVTAKGSSLDSHVRDLMTKDPVREEASTTIAFALTLMSHGGFRHLPIVHDDMPIALLTVKNVVDFLVHKMMEGLVDSVELSEAG